MRCTSCDYPLWNIAARVCPECGAAFSPRTYTFRAGSVRFCCPKCDQQYYGTSPEGLPQPDRFDCVRCGEPLVLDQLVVRPEPGVAEEDTRRDRMPWLERTKRGTVQAWFATVAKALFAPAALARAIPREAGYRSAYLYMLLTGLLFTAVGVALPQIGMLLFLSMAAPAGGGGPPAGLLIGVAVFWVVMALAIVAVAPVIWIALTNLLLLITGGTREGSRRTWQAICYSSGAAAPMAIPCFPYIGPIWWLVSAVIMVRGVHGISGFRAFVTTGLAGLLAMVVWVFLLFGLMVALVAPLGRTMVATSVLPAATAQASASAALSAYAADHDGRFPTHGLELMAYGMTPDQYVVWGLTTMDQVKIPGGTLLDAAAWSPEEKSQAARYAIAQLPAGAPLHRVGDIVFLSTGEVTADECPELLVFALLPKWPSEYGAVSQPIVMGTASGSSITVPRAALEARIAEENVLRELHGLPPLPPFLDDSPEEGTPLQGALDESREPEE
ncbi:MAG: hypothetical protein KDA22_08610 [Phycisphaerales bacterium]|nr:hypothetical protein [Phycisphaerales bacterium]